MKNKVLGIVIFSIICLFTYQSLVIPRLILDDFPLTEKWHLRLNSNIEEMTIVDDQTIIIRSCSEIYAIDLTNGGILWRFSTKCPFGGISPALFDDERIFFTDKQWVWAVEKSSGRVLWKHTVSDTNSEVRDVSKDYVAAFDYQKISVYDIENGNLVWDFPVCRNSNQLHLHGDKLFFPCDGMTAISLVTGKPLWETATKSGIWKAEYFDGVMYSSVEDENINATDLERKSRIWTTPLNIGAIFNLMLINDHLFVTGSSTLCNIDKLTGKLYWCVNGLNHPQNPAIVKDNVYIFNGPQLMISVIDLRTGEKIAQLRINKYSFIGMDRSLMVSTDRMLIFGSGRYLFGFGDQVGKYFFNVPVPQPGGGHQ